MATIDERNHFRLQQGVAVRALVEWSTRYAACYRKTVGQSIGNDYVLGESFASILQGVRGLLIGELGRQDGGELDGMIVDLAEAEGIDPDEL